MIKEKWSGILASIDSKTKVLALITLIAEALFIAAISVLPAEQIMNALITCAVILVVCVVGIIAIELAEVRSKKTVDLFPSPLTQGSQFLNDIINSSIQTVCRAASLPQTPESAKLRVFIFRRDGNQLVCSHYWSPNPAKEMVGKLRFELNSKLATRVAVVKAVLDENICRTNVVKLPEDLEGVTGEVSEELCFVLAAPVYNGGGNVWGTVDFDAGNEIGKALLATEVSNGVIYQLAKHLQIVLSLGRGETLSGKASRK